MSNMTGGLNVNRRLIREKTVCFTGHRSEKLPKGDVLKHLRIKLSEEIEKAIQDYQVMKISI